MGFGGIKAEKRNAVDGLKSVAPAREEAGDEMSNWVATRTPRIDGTGGTRANCNVGFNFPRLQHILDPSDCQRKGEGDFLTRICPEACIGAIGAC